MFYFTATDNNYWPPLVTLQESLVWKDLKWTDHKLGISSTLNPRPKHVMMVTQSIYKCRNVGQKRAIRVTAHFTSHNYQTTFFWKAMSYEPFH